MKSNQIAVLTLIAAALVIAVGLYPAQSSDKKISKLLATEKVEEKKVADKVQRTDEEWRQILTDEQYRVTRECGTEPAFTGKYYDFEEKGTYLCVGCGNELFVSDTKYHSGSGWPSFWSPSNDSAIAEKEDTSHGMTRTEIKCSRCGAHLGHVFEDGPAPTGLRFCVNSASLKFAADSSKKEDSIKTDK